MRLLSPFSAHFGRDYLPKRQAFWAGQLEAGGQGGWVGGWGRDIWVERAVILLRDSIPFSR